MRKERVIDCYNMGEVIYVCDHSPINGHIHCSMRGTGRKTVTSTFWLVSESRKFTEKAIQKHC